MFAGADGEPARRKPVALAAAEKAVIARPEKSDHLVHHMRRVERVVQAKAGKAEIDRQRAVDLVVPVVEQIGRIGHRRRQSVAQDIDRHRPLVEMAEVKQFEPERAAGGPSSSLSDLKRMSRQASKSRWAILSGSGANWASNGAPARSRARLTTSS